MKPLGTTRTVVHRNHAFIAPDGHVVQSLPGWTNTKGVILISPRLGARFIQYIAHLEAGSEATRALPGVERFVFVMEGSVVVEVAGKATTLLAHHYAWLPADVAHKISASGPGRAMVFEKYYHERLGVAAPKAIVGELAKCVSTPFLGDPDATLQLMLPDEPGFDMAVNVFTYRPGAALPFVETHIMEHGLTMLSGAGIYRLDDQWYPTQAGDTIWMGPYCPQWFCCHGKENAAYIYYKDINRDALAPEELP